jgi:hypothetical protein
VRVEKGALIKSLIESAILSNDILEELHKKRKKKKTGDLPLSVA